VKGLDVEIVPTRKIAVLGLDKRSIRDMAWCATTYGMSRLYWVEGYLLCLEVYDKSFEHEIKNKEFPKYEKMFEVDKSLQIPIVNASDMKIFKNLLAAMLNYEKGNSTTKKQV
jgi:hypothetical protein